LEECGFFSISITLTWKTSNPRVESLRTCTQFHPFSHKKWALTAVLLLRSEAEVQADLHICSAQLVLARLPYSKIAKAHHSFKKKTTTTTEDPQSKNNNANPHAHNLKIKIKIVSFLKQSPS
jgi:hypothetical protein